MKTKNEIKGKENSVKKSLAKMKNFSLISFLLKRFLMEKLCSPCDGERKKETETFPT